MKSALVSVCTLLAFLIVQPTFGATKYVLEISSGSGHAEFHAIGRPSALKIHGKGGKPIGRFEIADLAVTGSLKVLLDDFNTGISLRNEHMKKKYLETEKYPEAVLELTEFKLPTTLSNEDVKFEKIPFRAVLMLHGVKKEVDGQATISKQAKQITVLASFNLKVADYKIDSPKFSGITMADDVEVEVDFTGSLSP